MLNKKLVSLVLCASMIVSALPATTLADESFDEVDSSVIEEVEEEGIDEEESSETEVGNDYGIEMEEESASADSVEAETADPDTFDAPVDPEPLGTFTELQELVNSQTTTIVLEKDYIRGEDEDAVGVMEEKIGEDEYVPRTVVIDLNGHTIDANGLNDDALFVQNRSELVLYNGSITGAKSAVGVYGKATLSALDIYDCQKGVTVNGGGQAKIQASHIHDCTEQGIYIFSDAEIIATTIENNGTANGYNSYGGGIDMEQGSLILGNGTVITNNVAVTHGGGIYYYSGSVTIKGNVQVTGNYTQTDENKPKIPDDVYLHNSSLSVILNIGDSIVGSRIGVTMLDESLKLTKNLNTASGGNANGTEFFSNENDKCVMVDSTSGQAVVKSISSWDALCTAIKNAGAYETTIKLAGNCVRSSGTPSHITIGADQNITIDLNGKTIDAGHTASSRGQAMVINGSLTIDDTSSNHSGKITGGYRYSQAAGIENKGTLILNNGSIEGNNVVTDPNYGTAYGAGIYNTGSFTMNGGSIKDNTVINKDRNSKHFGAGIYISSGEVTINGGTLEGNVSPHFGGAIYLDEGTLTVNGGTFKDNRADGTATDGVYGPMGGGAIFAEGGTLSVNGGTFIGNYGGSDGGAILIAKSYKNDVTITKATFKGNTSMYGGAIANYHEGTVIKYCNFGGMNSTDGNAASRYGSAVASEKSASILGCIFQNNKCTSTSTYEYGGAVAIDYGEGTISIEDSSFMGNSAQYGAAVFNVSNKATVSLKNVTIKNNTAGIAGGGVYFGNESAFVLYDKVTIIDNTADGADNNVYLSANNYITVAGPLTESNIGVYCDIDTGDGEHVFTAGYKNNTASDMEIPFVSDVFEQAIVRSASGNELAFHMFQPVRLSGINADILSNTILNFYILPSDDLNVSTARVVVSGPNGEVSGTLGSYDYVDGKGYTIPYSIRARQYSEALTIEVFSGNEEKAIYVDKVAYEDGYTTCMNDYLYALISESSEYADIAEALTYYGYKSYEHFNPNAGGGIIAMIGNGATDVTESTVAEYAPKAYEDGYGEALVFRADWKSYKFDENYEAMKFGSIGFYGISLILRDCPTLRFYFKNDIRDSVFDVTYGGRKLSDSEYTVSEKGGWYILEISNIPMSNLDKVYSINFYSYAGWVSQSGVISSVKDAPTRCYCVEASPLSYVYSTLHKYASDTDKPSVYELSRALYWCFDEIRQYQSH